MPQEGRVWKRTRPSSFVLDTMTAKIILGDMMNITEAKRYVAWLQATIELEERTPPMRGAWISNARADQLKADAIADLRRDLHAAMNGLPVPGLGGEVLL